MRRFTAKVPPGVRRLLRLPWIRERMERDLEDEWRFHLEARAAELHALGLSESEAMAEAQRRFGDLGALRAGFVLSETRRARRLFAVE